MADNSGGPIDADKRLIFMPAANALDLALESQRMQSDLRDILLTFLPLLDGVEKLCRDLIRQSPEMILGRAEALSLLADVADQAKAKAGLEPCGSAGEAADYRKFDIVDAIPAPGAERGRVLDVIAQGWMFRGEVMRRARVIVSAGAADGAPKE